MADTTFERLTSKRLVLRRFRAGDIATFVGYRADPTIARFQSWENFTAADGEAFFAAIGNQHPDTPGEWFQFAIELTATAAMIGDCALHALAESPREVEIGFTLAPQFHGRGYATEAVACLLDYAFGPRAKEEALALTDVRNATSIAVLERLGFTRELGPRDRSCSRASRATSIFIACDKRIGWRDGRSSCRGDPMWSPHRDEIGATTLGRPCGGISCRGRPHRRGRDRIGELASDEGAMTVEQTVAQHYTHGSLETAILDGLRRSGKDPDRLDPDDLVAADEFHIGGRQATVEFADQLGLRPGMELLDIGSGIGGPARYFAHHRKCRVTGIDLTDEYVRVAGALSERTGLAGSLKFVQGSALALPFPPASFDGAYMLHVGMNISDKATLFGQAKHVLKPGGFFGVYDVMRIGAGELAFPVPWARTAESSFVASTDDYRRLLRAAGLTVQKEQERRAFGIEFFKKMQARVAESGLPPLGLHIVMGAEFRDKVRNLVANLENGLLAPIEMICRAT